MLSGNKFISIFRRLAILMLVFFVFIINTGKTLADDPEYAGERRFLGDKYPADPRMTMGALNFNFPIISPPGRSGLQPDLELSYSSNNNDNTSLFGYGWSINIPYIERINRTGVDKLYSENIFYSSLSGELEEITSTSTIQYMSASLMRESEIEVEINLMLARGEATQNSDGSIDFHTPKEKMEKRTKNSKTFIAGYTKNRKEIYMGRFYSGEVNYFNEDTRTYEEIDTKLIDNPNKWSMDKASYKANIKKDLKDNFLTFSNQGQELYFSLVGDSKKSIKASKETSGKWKNKQAVYKNALGKDIDLSLSLNNEALIKEAVINNLEALGDLSNQEYYEITFK
ncbi:MAG: SpvB/TcaC N-terminal domain-containing protein, partial [Patescibacteria group bacterium]